MTVDTLWNKIKISPTELSLEKVLRCGQTFRWKNINNTWSFTIEDRIILLKQDEENLHYSWLMKESLVDSSAAAISRQNTETLNFINDYFNLSINLTSLYKHWMIQNENYKNKKILSSPFTKFKGIRILRQDPWETTISFICSSNNNVKRISKMCENLCTEYGTYLNTYKGVDYFTFPSAKVLSSSPSVETKLRELGFGYRAKYIYQTARLLTSTLSIKELNSLRESSYEDSHSYLLQLTGVGPKVADCICLMALDKHDIVPVDTHVYQIAIRDYKFKGKKDLKTMNKKVYEDIREYFKEIFGEYAGWAQSVLFASDLSDMNNGINVKEEVIVEAKVTSTEVEIKEEITTEIKIEQDSKRKRVK